MTQICALIIVRDGTLPAGAGEVFEVAHRRGVVIGTGARIAAEQLGGPGTASVIEIDPASFSLRGCAAAAAEHIVVRSSKAIVVPSSPDGRDVAPRLAGLLHAPLLSGAVRVAVSPEALMVELSRSAGFVVEQQRVTCDQVVVTLIPGVTGVSETTEHVSVVADSTSEVAVKFPAGSVRSQAVLPPDPATMDLTEASHIVAGGQGLKSSAAFEKLGEIGVALGASLGGTRVASDAGWIPFDRQIGTTGLMVSPKVYIAFGISGATQHTSGLGSPELVISVNTDPSCPMMKMSDVAIVSDAVAVLEALAKRLSRVSA